MSRILLGLPLLGLLFACGPTGDTLGMEGTYKGVHKVEGFGSQTLFAYDPDVVIEVSTKNEIDATFSISPGYSNDAIVIGVECPIPLSASGSRLVLDAETHCNNIEEFETNDNNTRSLSKIYTYLTYTKFEIATSANGKITVVMEAQSETETFDKDGKTEGTLMDLKSSFEGVLVAEE